MHDDGARSDGRATHDDEGERRHRRRVDAAARLVLVAHADALTRLGR